MLLWHGYIALFVLGFFVFVFIESMDPSIYLFVSIIEVES